MREAPQDIAPVSAEGKAPALSDCDYRCDVKGHCVRFKVPVTIGANGKRRMSFADAAAAKIASENRT